MIQEINRRRMLGLSLGATTLAGFGLVTGAPSAVAADVPMRARRGCADPPIPTVPGMSGDPRANQCWFQLDEVGFYHASQEFIDAEAAVAKAVGNPDIEVGVAEAWINDRLAGTYPRGFISLLAPVRESLAVLSETEANVFNTYYGCDPHGLLSAVAAFGQGILYDPRRPVGAKVHMMDGTPPVGYHAWHAYNRAFAFLDIDAHYWSRFDPLVGFGWAVQSTAKPVTDTHNPPLSNAVVRGLARKWLKMPPGEIDQNFMTFPYPPGTK